MKLLSEYENEVVITDDPIKILRLKEMGFKEIKAVKEAKKGKGKDGSKKETE
jgi:hypothetical protein